MQFGIHLRRLRLDQHMSQRNLAALVGVDFTYISKIESGQLAPPSEEVLRKIARALDTDEDDLINRAGKVPTEIKVTLQDNPLLAELLRTLSEKRLPNEVYRQMLDVAMEQ